MSVNHLTDDFSSTNPHKSQERKILDALLAANGAWVSALDLSKISLQYSARIHSIRKTLGFDVENRVERTLDGGKRGYFRIRQFVSVADDRLLSTPARTEQNEPRAQPQVADRKAAENSPLLFPEGLLSGHRDDG
jgi:hypothetical protein